MPAYKEKDRNTWTVKIKHKNWNDQIKWVTKRGFLSDGLNTSQFAFMYGQS